MQQEPIDSTTLHIHHRAAVGYSVHNHFGQGRYWPRPRKRAKRAPFLMWCEEDEVADNDGLGANSDIDKDRL